MGKYFWKQIFLTQAYDQPSMRGCRSLESAGSTMRIDQEAWGGIRLALAQYRELAAFSQFASDLDEATRRQLERGERATEMMKQKQYSTMSVAEMGVSLFAVNEGYLMISRSTRLWTSNKRCKANEEPAVRPHRGAESRPSL
ncbi:MAG: hypothetical protein Ct9H300mP14_10280 [Gammaproteobacteria bacterium]|nr:MAG: hypothetical protein Ct9H300mP14_10280 [Gammaproteobacteria bacterium]